VKGRDFLFFLFHTCEIASGQGLAACSPVQEDHWHTSADSVDDYWDV